MPDRATDRPRNAFMQNGAIHFRARQGGCLCPAALVRLLTPHRQTQDVFPAYYRMNTRGALQRIFETYGFQEVTFAYLDDCALMQRFRLTCFLELIAWKTFRTLGVSYPENNLLAIYQRSKVMLG